MGYQQTEPVRAAHDALHDAYQREKAERAKVAWQNGIKWVVYQLQDGASLEDVISKAQDHEVVF